MLYIKLFYNFIVKIQNINLYKKLKKCLNCNIHL